MPYTVNTTPSMFLMITHQEPITAMKRRCSEAQYLVLVSRILKDDEANFDVVSELMHISVTVHDGQLDD